MALEDLKYNRTLLQDAVDLMKDGKVRFRTGQDDATAEAIRASEDALFELNRQIAAMERKRLAGTTAEAA